MCIRDSICCGQCRKKQNIYSKNGCRSPNNCDGCKKTLAITVSTGIAMWLMGTLYILHSHYPLKRAAFSMFGLCQGKECIEWLIKSKVSMVSYLMLRNINWCLHKLKQLSSQLEVQMYCCLTIWSSLWQFRQHLMVHTALNSTKLTNRNIFMDLFTFIELDEIHNRWFHLYLSLK